MKISMSKAMVRGERRWKVSHRQAGKRVRAFFKSKAEAEAEVSRLQDEVARSGEAWVSLPVHERDKLMQAYLLSKERGVDLAAALKEAPTTGDGPTVGTVVTDLVTSRKNGGCSTAYVTGLETILNQFVRGREGVRVAKVGLRDVEKFLNSKALNSRPTLRARLSRLFKFAISQGYRLDNPCDRLEPIRIEQKPPAIFTVEQTAACLRFLNGTHKPSKHSPRVSYRRALPWFVLATFCGLRPEEAEQIGSANINFKEGWVRVEITKIRQRRVVYPKPEAMRLLNAALKKGKLPITHQARKRYMRRLRDHLGWKAWPKDVTRHTAASYWLADCRSAADVAESLGHSETILKRHYKALVTKEEARKFWALKL